ncbi:uncharacterized protein LOC105688294 [Athalia rosae]|uniref:uncharacterized protein LOC105688294 n=1 Tax=Athalia rosae TaxID=37344 RepID=UPI000626BDD2|nr:uncharacterized protein LOC105688294 [Athalia rosae]
MLNDWKDNLRIFYANLTWFYVASIMISCLAIALVSWGNSLFKINRDIHEDDTDDRELSTESTEHSFQTQYKLARQKLTEQPLTPEQRSKEREAETQQLTAILKLLQQQSDTFQVSSMHQLEDQLKLYRK